MVILLFLSIFTFQGEPNSFSEPGNEIFADGEDFVVYMNNQNWMYEALRGKWNDVPNNFPTAEDDPKGDYGGTQTVCWKPITDTEFDQYEYPANSVFSACNINWLLLGWTFYSLQIAACGYLTDNRHLQTDKR